MHVCQAETFAWQLHPAVFHYANCMCRLFLAFLCCSEYIAFTTEVEAYFFKIFISIMFQICFKVICRGIETESLYMYIFVKNVVIKIIISVSTYLHMSV